MKKTKTTKKELKRLFVLEVVMFLLVVFVFGVTVFFYLERNPGMVFLKDIEINERGVDTIQIDWEETRHAERYFVYYKKTGKAFEDRERLIVEDHEAKISGLNEGTKYTIRIYADDGTIKGIPSEPLYVTTRKTPNIEVSKHITKSTDSKAFKPVTHSDTVLSFESDNTDVAVVDSKTGEVTIKGEGSAKIKITSKQNRDYVATEKTVRLLVLNLKPSGSIKTVYSLNSSNCERIMYVTGSGSAVVPQSFGYTGKEYIIAYGMQNSQAIVRYNIKTGEKTVSKPSVALGHPNGFTYCPDNKQCYCVRGWSGRAVVYNTETGKYSVMTFRNGLSGIAYDRKTKQFYGSSRTGTTVYNLDYSVSKFFRNVNHNGHVYTQDCGGHDDIFIRCLSPSGKHGKNYVDLYRVDTGRYIGTISVDLGEVESAIVDDEGYLELLVNGKSKTDIIWKTPIKIEGMIE